MAGEDQRKGTQTFNRQELNFYTHGTPPLYVHDSERVGGGGGGDGYFSFSPQMSISEPVFPNGKALGRSADGLWFDPLGLSSLLKNCGL